MRPTSPRAEGPSRDSSTFSSSRASPALRSGARAVSLGLLLCASCQYNPFLPDLRTPADFAREVAPRCRGFTEETAAPVLSPAIVDSVDPAYTHVQSGPGDREARLRGARIRLRPIPGFSREAIGRTLECHQSRVVLEALAPSSDDPYALAGHWLSIDVDAELDGFIVDVRAGSRDGIAIARDILERAKRLAARRDMP
jgi:hypothetical protein